MDEKRGAILAELPRLRRYARALVRDRDVADDLVQDCIEKALTRMEGWQNGDNPRRWLFTIMHHLFVDQLRRTKRRGASVSYEDATGAALATEPSQFDSIAAREVLQALQAIAPDRRSALVLVAVEGLTYAEAATVLGIPAGTVMSRIARGREELRKELEDASRRRTIRVVQR
ncbi:MAG: RNA polymerase sigma factor [Mesorhizobium sp.]|nr:RNA polymerase sigma factor [Mesorhizobium sp.]MCO5159780.1 RNA polymerase sigma factor [Mesorhizobium sp.]